MAGYAACGYLYLYSATYSSWIEYSSGPENSFQINLVLTLFKKVFSLSFAAYSVLSVYLYFNWLFFPQYEGLIFYN